MEAQTQGHRPAAVSETKRSPHVISLERVGWRIMSKAPGQAARECGTHVDKQMALKLAIVATQKLADNLGETVELHTQDAKGRESTKSYVDPTPEPEPAKEEKKGGEE